MRTFSPRPSFSAGIAAGLLAAACLAAGACYRDQSRGATAGTDPGKEGAAADAAPAAVTDPLALRDLGRGLKPQRGRVLTDPPGVPVEFEPAEMDFGVLPPGGTARGTSRIWNVSTQPLVIYGSITSCGCTSAEDLTGRVIEPGSYTEFSTTMEMKSGLGEKREKITVFFAPDYGRPAAVQFYSAEVSLPVKLTPPHIPASELVDDRWVHTMAGTIDLATLDGRPFRIIRSHGRPPDFVGFDPAVDAPSDRYTIRWDLNRFNGAIPWFWVIETDLPDCPLVDARIQHSKTIPLVPRGRPWVPKDQRVLVGIIHAGEPFEVTTRIEFGKDSNRNDIPPDESQVSVTSESPFFDAELLETQIDGQFVQYRIKVTPSETAEPGLFYGPLAVWASGFSAPLYVIGRLDP